MSYFFGCNEEIEFKRLNGRLYLWVIHKDHSHNGMQPHVHVLDLTNLSIGEAEVEKNNESILRNGKKFRDSGTILKKSLKSTMVCFFLYVKSKSYN